MSPSARKEFEAQALADSPRESCGLLVAVGNKDRYVPCRNIAPDPEETFTLAPQDYLAARRLGKVLAVCHSHPKTSEEPSKADLAACEKLGLPWYILSVATLQINRIAPSGYVVPLLGREFVHAVLDCYALIRDYYAQTLSVSLPDFEREDLWWDKGQNLYMDNFEKAGFRVVHDLRVHDVLLMQLRSKKVPNHAAVYLGDDLIMQHLSGRLSSRDPYGGQWLKHTTHRLRHESQL